MWQAWFIAAWTLVILGVIASVFVIARWLERRRAQQLQDVARELGFDYTETVPPGIDTLTGRFALFGLGHRRKSWNVLRREADGVLVVLLDHAYTTGSGKNQHRHTQTVALFQSRDLSVPQFRLSPEGWLSKISHFFGVKDIDFDDCPEFSTRFQLSGPDEAAIRGFFSQEQLLSLVDYDRLCVEALDDCITIWHQDRKIAPDGIRSFFERSFEVFSILKSRGDRHSRTG